METSQRVEAAKATFEHLWEVLVRVEVDLASERKRREVKVEKAKEAMAKEKREVTENAVEAYKASIDFMVKKA